MQAQVKLQEHGSCFTIFYLEDVVVCGCNKPACQDGVKQLFDCSAQLKRGPVRCAWFDSQTRYASVEMTAEEAAHARERQQSENVTTDSVSVCTRAVTAEQSLQSPMDSPESYSDGTNTPPSLCDLSPQSCTVTTDELLRWATDPMLSDSCSEWSWSREAQCKYSNAESPLYISYSVGERVMLRPSELMFHAQGATKSDGPYIITGVLDENNYKVRREHEHYSQVVHYSRILSRFSSEGKAHTSDPPGVDPQTSQDVAACQTSDRAVTLWLNDVATHISAGKSRYCDKSGAPNAKPYSQPCSESWAETCIKNHAPAGPPPGLRA